LHLLVVSKGGVKRKFDKYIIEKFELDNDLVLKVEVENYPDSDKLASLINGLRAKNITSIYAIGGGSVLDIAKVLSVLVQSNSKVSTFDLKNFGKSNKRINKIPLYVIPTTSGTGAEVTQFATIWDKTSNEKFSIDNNLLIPTQYYLDGNLLTHLNFENFLYPALDCISHTLESIWNINRTKESLVFSTKALDKISNEVDSFTSEKFMDINFDEMLMASNYAGKAINITRTSIAHAISYPYTLKFGVPHGLACSFTLPKIHHYVYNELKDKKYIEIINDYKDVISFLMNFDFKEIMFSFTAGQLIGLNQDDLNTTRSSTFLSKLNEDLIIKFNS
jgi:alcohol dehydrogenase class IV